MALLPYLLDYELRPRRLRNSLLGFDSDDDFLTDIFDRPLSRVERYIRPWKNLEAVARNVGSTIKADKDKFQINLDVQHFSPEEISVKTADGYVVIEGKHEEKKDEHGYVSREFRRRYALPEGCDPESVQSKLSTDGVLTVVAPKTPSIKGEREVPLTLTGPVRRKKVDETESKETINGEAEEEVKSPQKKKKR